MTVEQSFLSYREHGDVRALGAVFDAVAQELALVAAHLAPTGIEAEDLVQATFVEAIEHAERWDPARPLVPWLIGILVNHARRERTRGQRTPPVRAATGEPDPLDVVELREVGERIGAALRGLPRHYRQALTLRLLHGLQPAQIATALGCPVATCKTRLQRGMEMLRRALPAGIGATFAALLLTGKGLASCREIVMAKAASCAVTTTAVSTTILAGAAMKKTLTAVLAIAFLTTAVTLWPPSAGHTEAAHDAPLPSTPEQVATTAPSEVRAPPAERTPADTVVEQPARAGQTPVIRGRVVDEHEQGLPDVLVALGRQSPDGEFSDVSMFLLYRALNPGKAPRLPRERLTKSDSAGRFTFTATLREQGSVLVAWSPQRGVAFVPLPAEGDDRAGEFVLVLPDCGQLFGRIVSQDGQPVPDVQVNVYPAKSGMPAATAIADAEGNYRTVPLPPAAYRLIASSPAHGNHVAHGELGRDDLRVDLELPLLPVFSALLVDAQQSAWTGLRIENVCGVDLGRLAVLATPESCSRRAEAARGGRSEERLVYDPQTGGVQAPIRNDRVAFLSLWHGETRLAEVPLRSLEQEVVELTLAPLPQQTLRVLLTFDPHPSQPVRSKVRLDRPAGRLGSEFRTEVETTITGSLASLSVPASEIATSWWLSIDADGYAVSDQLLAWPAQTPLLVHEVRLVRNTRSVHGVVAGPDGAEIEGAGVLVLAADGTFVGRLRNVFATTDRHGAFRIDHLPDRALRLLVDAGEGGMATMDVPLDEAMPLRVVTAATRLLHVHGTDGEGVQLRVLDRDGHTLVDDRLRGRIRYGSPLQLGVAGEAHRVEAYLPCSPEPFASGERSVDGDAFHLTRLVK